MDALTALPSAGLADPGSNGLIKRTSLNVTAPAVAGTDYLGDPGSNGIMKRTALNTTTVATNADYVVPVNAPTAWTAPSLLNGWANVASYAAAQYRIDALGEVHIRASLMSGTITDGTTLFVLPAGFRPPVQLYVSASYSAGSYLLFTALKIDASGNVTIGGVTGNSFLAINTSFSTFT